ncbi:MULTISPECIES: helix-turn-helix domain-containing protein [Deefgea]|uniref:Helix-turn-helix domain-containing protein n=1 Tax=Deefgea chitinilytica TaxID=570276 RepID=A0ABS2CD81_9NEIS|nr:MULTISPECIES: helix-turn-helix transcriptional regulator [Deefgea]MBM5572094.1 helix-turn-helix domain-containing protein [Deefgea chitinilytica]MBM9889329.1 helix-turn-helix transcriptional regulator [Deefgea sp. CFH1-16]
MPIQSPFPIRLKEARTIKGLTQVQLGVRIGMDENSASARMNQYEKGKHAPDFDTMKRMAEELGVPVAYFFCETELDAKLMQMLHLLSKQQKERLLIQLANQD